MLVRPRFRLLPLALRLRRPLLPLLVLRHALVVIARRADAVRLFQQLRLQRLPDGGQIPAVLPGQSVLPGDLPHSLADSFLRQGPRRRAPGLLQTPDAVQGVPDAVRPGKAGLHGGIFRQPRPLLFVFLLIIAVSEFRKLPVVILPGAVGFLRRAVSLPGIRLCGHPRRPCGDLRTPEVQKLLVSLIPQCPQLFRPALRLPCRGCDLTQFSGSCWPSGFFSSGGFAHRLAGHRRQGGGRAPSRAPHPKFRCRGSFFLCCFCLTCGRCAPHSEFWRRHPLPPIPHCHNSAATAGSGSAHLRSANPTHRPSAGGQPGFVHCPAFPQTG